MRLSRTHTIGYLGAALAIVATEREMFDLNMGCLLHRNARGAESDADEITYVKAGGDVFIETVGFCAQYVEIMFPVCLLHAR